MKYLISANLVWTFFGAYMYDYFGGIDTVLSVNMVLASFYGMYYFKSLWASLCLMVSIPAFLNHIIIGLNITHHAELLSVITTLLILSFIYLPNLYLKWNL